VSNPDNIPSSSDEHEDPPSEKAPSGNSSSSGKANGDSIRMIPAPEKDSAPMVPLDTANPDRTVVSIMENPSVLEALVHEAPAEVIKFVESSDDRQFRYYSQKEENRHKERLARETTTRLAVAGVLGCAFAAFGYSAITGDTNLSNQIISVIVGGFGGLGISKLFQNKDED